jgi:hypothetical protein
VRAGVEGRSEIHQFFGERYDEPPALFWPGLVAVKVPLALLVLGLLGAVAIGRLSLSRQSQLTLTAVAVVTVAHLAALMGSSSSYGGVRHALPLVTGLAILGGAVAAAAAAVARRRRLWLVASIGLPALALAMTAGEPRLWEYHNVLGGGTEGAYRNFMNEGIDLGQRVHELRAFHDVHIKPTGKPLYVMWYRMMQGEFGKDKLDITPWVEDLDDTNTAGVFDGFFVVSKVATMRTPDWDPSFLDSLEKVASFGYVSVYRGRITHQRQRAEVMFEKCLDELFLAPKPDLQKVVKRLEEIVATLPTNPIPTIELGNVYLRLQSGADALRAFKAAIANLPEGNPTRKELQESVHMLEAGAPLSTVPRVRNPLLE